MLHGSESVTQAGLTLSLIADSYFALRYKDESDSIAFSALELFAMESWTQHAFNKSKFLYMQITAATFIFA